MYQARALTQESSASITRIHTDGRGLTRKAKMAYFFAVLEDQLGLTDGGPAELNGREPKTKPTPTPDAAPAPGAPARNGKGGKYSEGFEDYVVR